MLAMMIGKRKRLDTGHPALRDIAIGLISGTIIELVGPDRRVKLNEIQPASLVLGCFQS